MKVRLEELIKVRTGKLDANVANENGQYPFFTCSKEPLSINTYSYDCECVLVAGNGDLNVKYYNGKFDAYQRTYILESNSNKLYMPYLYFFMDEYVDTLRKQSIGGVIKYIKLENIINASIELPEVNSQKEICNKIYKVKGLINKQKKTISYLDTLIKARFVEMFGDPLSNKKRWEKKKLGEKCEIITGNTPSRNNQQYYGDYIEWIKSDNINTPSIFLTKAHEYLSEVGAKVGRIVEKGAVLMTCIAGSLSCIGNVGIADRKVAFNQQINAIIPSNDNPYYLYVLFELTKKELQSSVDMMLKGIVSKSKLESQEYIFPPIELQNQFATFVKQVDKLKLDVQKSFEKTQMLFGSLMQQHFR